MDFTTLKRTITVATICVALIIAVCLPAAYTFDLLARHHERMAMVAQTAAADAAAQAFGAHKDTSWIPRNLLLDMALVDGMWIEVSDAKGAKNLRARCRTILAIASPRSGDRPIR